MGGDKPLNDEGNRTLTTPRAEPNRSVSGDDRRAAIEAISPSEVGGRVDQGGVSTVATGSRYGSIVSTEAASIERAYRMRLRPNRAQARVLSRLFGARRNIWNWALRRKDEAYRADGTQLSGIDLSREFTALRQAPGTAWLASLPREPFNQTLRDFDKAWKNFFAGRAKRPRRRRFGTVQSARFTLDQRRHQVDRDTGSVQLDGVGRVRFRVTEPLTGRLRSVTVSRDAASRWFACFTADQAPAPVITAAPRSALGIDLGLKDTAVLSDGTHIAAPKYLAKHQRRLRRYQRHYVRQRDAAAKRQGLDPSKPFPKGTRIAISNRMRRTKYQIGTLHARVADCWRDHQHQLTTRAVAGAAIICIEDLAVKGMGRGMHLGFRRSVADAGLGEVRRQLTYKAAWRHRTLSVVDRWYPSSKTCSACAYVNAGLKLQDRRWTCAQCGAEHGRDLNAAINIEREGLRLLAGQPGAQAPGGTRRSRGTHARGDHACAAGKSSPTGQPRSENREPVYRTAPPRTPARRRLERRRAGEG